MDMVIILNYSHMCRVQADYIGLDKLMEQDETQIQARSLHLEL